MERGASPSRGTRGRTNPNSVRAGAEGLLDLTPHHDLAILLRWLNAKGLGRHCLSGLIRIDRAQKELPVPRCVGGWLMMQPAGSGPANQARRFTWDGHGVVRDICWQFFRESVVLQSAGPVPDAPPPARSPGALDTLLLMV